jgi:16S rRNA (guanine966-N2)-methyltransferase
MVTFIESDRRAQALIAENLARCGIESGYAIIRATVARGLEQVQAAAPAFAPFDIILLDPPYSEPADAMLRGADAVSAPDGLVVLEHARRQLSPDVAGRLVRTRVLTSGDSTLSFYTCRP